MLLQGYNLNLGPLKYKEKRPKASIGLYGYSILSRLVLYWNVTGPRHDVPRVYKQPSGVAGHMRIARSTLVGTAVACALFGPNLYAADAPAAAPAGPSPATSDQGSVPLEEVVVTGIRRSVEESLEAKRDAVNVEDVITSGGSALQAIEAVTAEGGSVAGVLAVVDREQGGREKLEAAGFAVRSLTTAKALGLKG